MLGRDPRPGDRHVPRREQVARAAALGEIDNRGSHFYLALYWAQELADADRRTPSSPAAFAELAKTLAANEATINEELLAVQGSPADIGGYYRPDPEKAAAVMRPSATFNQIVSKLG